MRDIWIKRLCECSLSPSWPEWGMCRSAIWSAQSASEWLPFAALATSLRAALPIRMSSTFSMTEKCRHGLQHRSQMTYAWCARFHWKLRSIYARRNCSDGDGCAALLANAPARFRRITSSRSACSAPRNSDFYVAVFLLIIIWSKLCIHFVPEPETELPKSTRSTIVLQCMRLHFNDSTRHGQKNEQMKEWKKAKNTVFIGLMSE